VSRRRLRTWAALAIGVSVGLWVAQALIGLNYYDEQDSYPWFLRAVQWLALVLVLGSLVVLMWTMSRPRRNA
jgi:FtsH-binding integral membrane protein